MADKAIEDVKRKVAAEIKVLPGKTQKCCVDAKSLRKEKTELAKKKDPSEDDKKREVDLRKALEALEKTYLNNVNTAAQCVNRVLKTSVPDDQKSWPEWQKGMEKWYRDLVEKESGLDLGDDLKLTGDISIKDKKATIILKGKF